MPNSNCETWRRICDDLGSKILVLCWSYNSRNGRLTVSDYVDILDNQVHHMVQMFLRHVHTFRFSTDRQVLIISGQSSRTQESIGLFTQTGLLTGRNFIGRQRVATGAIHYYARSPAGSWVNSGAGVVCR